MTRPPITDADLRRLFYLRAQDQQRFGKVAARFLPGIHTRIVQAETELAATNERFGAFVAEIEELAELGARGREWTYGRILTRVRELKAGGECGPDG